MKTAGFSVEAPGVKFFRLLAVGVQGTLLLLLLFGPAWRATSNSAAIQSALTVTALFPANGAVGLPIDVPLKITFNAAPSLGASGLIRIRDAATNAVVDTINLAAASQTRTVAGTVYNYRPVIINGNTALITPHVALLYNKKYYVTIDAGAFRTATGVFAGIGSSTGWQFNTKPAAPAAGATTLVVASNGTADFATVQGAIDFVPAGNTVRRLISIRRGSYQELIRVNSNKPLITLRGEDRKGTVIAYANNANFNPNSRSVVWVNAADWTIQNLTVRNLTPQGGSQAEAVRTNALRSQIRSCDLYSFQDTLQLNGSAYVENSYIEGDVDFMWGNAAAYFLNCELRNVRSGGYYIQARTPQNQPGFVYVNCRLTGSSGITGAFLARIDPNAFPYSQVVFINSAMGPQVSPAGWLLNNATSSSTIRFWEYRSTDLNGNLLNVSRRIASSRQLTAAQAAQWSNPTFVLGGWVPQAPSLAQSQPVNRTISEAGGPASLAAVPVTGAPSLSPVKLLKQPVGQTVFARNTVAFSVTAQGVPSPSYQWFKDGAPIPGATSPTLVMTAVQPAASGSYTAVAANLVGSVTSKPARLAVFMPGDLIAQQPQRQVVNIGETARLTVKAREPGPIGYQWRKNGADIPGATDSTLTLPDVQPTATGVYTVLVSHLTEATLSAPAILAVTSPTTQLPPLANFVMEGFAGLGQGTTGGGIVDPSDTAHYKVIDASTPNPAQTLQGYLQSAEPLVIELRTDVDLGALNNQNRRPLINPELIASNLGVIRIASNKTLFSDRGATLRHGTLRIDNTQNIIIRNLKFRGLWEWDDSTRGAYDLQGWDLIEVSGGRNVWIDHCDFAKAYDGQVDVVRGADLVTVSFSRFTGDLETEVVDQINYLESLYQANPGDPRISYYSSLRQAGQSVQQILTHEIPQDKTSLVGNGDGAGATDNGRLNVTYHHNAFTLIRQRTPRMRFGNAHVYNIMVDDIASAPFPGTQTAVNSTTNAAVLVENSEFLEVRMPFAFSNGGRISQRGSVWQLNGAPRPIDPARLSPVDPNALIWNPPLSFIWTDRTKLPYAYTLSPVDFVRTHLNQVGTITPVDAADQALLRGYLPLTAPVENPDGPPPPSPPTITTQPASRSATVGDSVIFSVVADGTAPLSYQWKKDGSDISGATGANLTLTSVQLADAGSYSVEIGNEAGIATSDPAILTIEVASVSSLRERFADGDRTTQNLPDSTAWFTSSGSNNLTATVGQATQIVSSSRTLLSYFTDSAAAPVSVGLNQTLTLDFTVQFTGFDTAASVGANTFIVGLLRSVANPAAVSGTGFVADGPPNTNARVSGDFGSNNPGSNVFNNYGGYAAMTYTGVSGTNTPVRLYARTGASASLLNSTGPFTQLTGAAATPSVAMAANVDYRGTFTLQHTAAGMAVTYTLRDPINDSIVMTHSAVQPGSSLTEFETVAFYLSKASASAGYNFIIKAVDVTLSGSEQGDSPVITTEPVSQTVPVGANASFMAVAEGAPPLSYQWQKNGSPIAGATATVLALTNVQAADAGGYRVVVSNAAGSTTSATAMLTVDLGPVAPTITSQPASQVVAVGSNAGFTVLATGTGPLSYQWFKDGSPLAAPDAATLNLTNVQPSDAGSYRVVVSNGVGSTTSNPATLIASDTLPDALYNLAGFAQSATGGGLLPETDPNYRKVFTADDLVTALANKSTKVIEIMNDLNLGFNEVPATARRGALRANSAPLLHPVLLTTGVSLIDIQDKNGLTIFSANGATIRHATFNVKRATNVLIRNLKFDELWEWDESSKGKYDKQGWDFITVDMDSDQVVIDHCTFTKAYDGVVDIKGGTKNVTISWSSFVADDGGPNSFVRQQIAALESNRAANPMYDFLRTNGFSIEDIVAITRSQKKGHLIGANELDTENANHQVTLHHNYYLNMQDRLPRLRAGNSHAYNILVDNTEAFAAKNLRDTIVAAMTPSNAARLSSTYSFDVTLNGSISTEGGAVLLEKSQFVGVKSPLRNNQKDAAQAQFTGKILALDTLYRLDGPIFRGDSTTPGSPLAPVPAPALEFSWNGFVSLPYVYTTHDPTALPSLLSGGQGAGAGKLLWARENWLKTSY